MNLNFNLIKNVNKALTVLSHVLIGNKVTILGHAKGSSIPPIDTLKGGGRGQHEHSSIGIELVLMFERSMVRKRGGRR